MRLLLTVGVAVVVADEAAAAAVAVVLVEVVFVGVETVVADAVAGTSSAIDEVGLLPRLSPLMRALSFAQFAASLASDFSCIQ